MNHIQLTDDQFRQWMAHQEKIDQVKLILQKDIISVKEAAQAYDVHMNWIQTAIKEGRIPNIGTSKAQLINRKDLLEMLMGLNR